MLAFNEVKIQIFVIFDSKLNAQTEIEQAENYDFNCFENFDYKPVS